MPFAWNGAQGEEMVAGLCSCALAAGPRAVPAGQAPAEGTGGSAAAWWGRELHPIPLLCAASFQQGWREVLLAGKQKLLRSHQMTVKLLFGATGFLTEAAPSSSPCSWGLWGKSLALGFWGKSPSQTHAVVLFGE